jgi:hypothetical protein
VKTEDCKIDAHKKQAGGGKCGAQGEYAEIPDLGWFDVDDTRSVLRKDEREQNAERRDDAVGRYDDASDVKEDRVHWRQDTAAGLMELAETAED